MDNIALIDGYNMRLDDEIDSGLFRARRIYFEKFRARHLPDIDELPPEGAIVDAGCFTGSKTQSLLRRYEGRSLLGIDINNRALKVARDRFSSEEVGFTQGDIRELQKSIADAAMVFSSQVYHHFGKDDRLSAFDAAHKSLRYGGKLVISDTFLDLNRPLCRLMVAGYASITGCPYVNVLPSEIIADAQRTGFRFDRIHHTVPGALISGKLGIYPSSIITFTK